MEYCRINLQWDDTEQLIAALADALCWFDGFQSGSGESTPVDTETLREFNIKLKKAWNKRKENQTHERTDGKPTGDSGGAGKGPGPGRDQDIPPDITH
jgi:hypothetical protein